MSYWWGYFNYGSMSFIDDEALKRKRQFIKSKMMKRNRKLKGNKRGK